MHGVHDVQLGAVVVGPFPVHQSLRDDAHHAPTGFQGGVRHDTHQAAFAAAIDQLATVLANPVANSLRRLDKFGLGAGLGAAIHTH